MKTKGLGRGINALISDNLDNNIIDKTSDSLSDNKEGIINININLIEPNLKQPRQYFDEDKLNDLKNSIEEYGLIQPIIVKKNGDYYEIIAGERRWRAAKKAGLKEIPVIIKDYTNEEILEISLIENIQRQDLNPIEEALAFERLINEYNLKQEEVANKVSRSRSAITNSLRLLNLDKRIQQFLKEGVLSSGHARSLLAIEDKNMQYDIALEIIDNDLNVRQTERLIKSIKQNKNKKVKINKEKSPIYKDLEEQIKEILGTKVQIVKGKKKGKIEIEYYSEDDLDRIFGLFKSIR